MAARPRTAPAAPSAGVAIPPDLFILVRPPPSVSTHPLNLQIQLLVPSISREPPQRRSGEYSRSSSQAGSIADDRQSTTAASATSLDAVAGASVSRSGSRGSGTDDSLGSGARAEDLKRTNSVGSTRSGRSTASGSVGSEYSGPSSTGTGGRRRVTPLLNLNFHSVLPTVVTDAGTDQRVAKFLKRGVEMTGLAILDPLDLSNPPTPSSTLAVPSASSPAPAPPPPPSTSTNTSSGPASNLFSRFKKLSFGAKPPPSSSPSQQTPPSSPFSSFLPRSTSNSSNTSSNTSTSSPSKFLSSLTSTSTGEGAPTPRTVPLLRTPSDDGVSQLHPSPPPSAPLPPPPTGYAFVVRKWLRDDLASASGSGGTPRPNTEVRIEWARSRERGYKNGRGRRTDAGRSSISLARSSDAGQGGSPAPILEGEEGEAAEGGEGQPPPSPEEADDDGEESDPEDSERPWVCTLVYPSSASSSSSSSRPVSSTPTSSTMSPSASQRPRRLHLATLRPAPHHPKLVSTLLLPPSLPSIPLGTFSPSRGLQGGVLSLEELRDLAMVSAMWVAIREGLGGLARERDAVGGVAAGLGLTKVRSGRVSKGLREKMGGRR
ncbi:hypothetical protein JCM21900_005351 [Sporobolomyces salmonicolor]